MGSKNAPGIAGVVLGAAALGAAAVAVGARCLQLARTQSGIARVREIRVGDGGRARVLSLGGVYQSATYLDDRRLEPVFAYILAFDAAFEAEEDMRAETGHGIDRMLMLGGGGFAYPKHALTQHEGLSMDVVEIDAMITHLARRWFFLDELEQIAGSRLQIITQDGRSYLEEWVSHGARYDVILNDCFIGCDPVRELASVEAMRLVRANLRPGGMYLSNVVSCSDGEDIGFLRACASAASEVFEHVHVVPCTDETLGGEDNYLLIATDGAYRFDEEIPLPPGFLCAPLRDGGEGAA